MTSDVGTCPSCGGQLPADAPNGFCPGCLYRLGFGGAAGGSVSDPWATAHDPSPSADVQDLPPNRSFGDYELLERIGHGGMGVVYKACQKSLNRMVALKLLPLGPHAPPESVKRFRAEAVSTAALQHPNIVAIHEVGFSEGQHFIAMDYVEGQPLSELIRGTPLPPRRAASYVKTIAEAIHYAHERGILHRDLKPANVLIDASDQPRVTDFGLAKKLADSQLSTPDSQLTVTGQVLGSPNYMPPEQAAGGRGTLSRRTDVYALGAILYHALTGRPPYLGEGLADIVQQVLHTEPVAPRLLNGALPRDLETVCLKCLEKEPGKRYPTAQALAEELGRFLEGQPIQARPVGPAGRTWRWCRRNPRLAGALGVAALSLVIGLATTSWQWRRAESQRQRAEASELAALQRAYISEINAAQAGLKAINPGRALEILNRHRPKGKSESPGGPPPNPKSQIDLRGFEWRYLWQQCQTEAEAVVGRLPDAIPSLEMSGDGQWLMAASEAGAVTLWHLATGEEILLASARGVRAFGAFSPDSRFLLFCDQSLEAVGTISVWDLRARKRLPPITDPRPVGPMVFSPDGKWFSYGVASLSSDKEGRGKALVLLAFPSRENAREMPCLTPITTINHGWDWVFTPDSRRIIFSETDPDPQIGQWDIIDVSPPRYFPGARESLTALALSPDGSLLATSAGYTNNNIKLWELPSFRSLAELSGHQGWVRALKFSPDGRTLASASVDQTIRLWDVSTRQPKRVFRGLAAEVWRLSFAPDGRKLFSGSGDGTIHRWPTETHPSSAEPGFWRVSSGLDAVKMAPGGEQFIGLRHGRVYLGATQAGAPVLQTLGLGTNNTCVMFSRDEQALFAGTKDGEIQVWSLSEHRLVHRLQGAREPVVTLRQAATAGCLVAVQFQQGERLAPLRHVGVWSTMSWQRQNLLSVSGLVSCYEVSPDGRWLATGEFRGPVRIWSLDNSSEPRTANSTGQTMALAFSGSGHLLAAATLEGVVRVWQMPRTGEAKGIPGTGPLAFSVGFLSGQPPVGHGGSRPGGRQALGRSHLGRADHPVG